MARHDKQSRWMVMVRPDVREFLDDVPQSVLVDMFNERIDAARNSLNETKNKKSG